MDINSVNISGRLTRDPELRFTQTGLEVLSFSLAVNGSKKNEKGEWEDVPNYFDSTVFGARARTLSEHLKKGMKVFVNGRLQWSQWEDDGKKRSKVSIVCNTVDYEAPKKSTPPPNQGYVTQPTMTDETPTLYDEDIPF